MDEATPTPTSGEHVTSDVGASGTVASRSQRVFAMLGAALGTLLGALDHMIILTAGPRIQEDLAIEANVFAWIITAYVVGTTMLIPIYGKLSDVYGRRRMLMIAVGIFLLGSALCGVSETATQLIVFRGLQGTGAAGLFTVAAAVVADLFPPTERAKWMGVFSAVYGVSSMIGPTIGGFITDRYGWHWAFFINLPVGLVALGFMAYMPALRRPAAGPPRLDLHGALALIVAVLPLLLALSLGHSETTGVSGLTWTSWPILTLFGISAVGIIGFVLAERRAVSPILDLRLFRIPTFAIGSLGVFVAGAASLGSMVFVPVFMVNVVGLSAARSGLIMAPITAGLLTGTVVAGQLVSRLGRYKHLLLGSFVVVGGISLAVAATLTPEVTSASLAVKMLVLGLGLGPLLPLFTLALQSAVPDQLGVASGAATFFRQLGGTIAIALAGTVFATSFATSLQLGLPEARRDAPAALIAELARHPASSADPVVFDADAIARRVQLAVDALPIPEAARRAAHDQAHAAIGRIGRAYKLAFTEALADVYWMLLGIAAAGLAITALLPQLPLRRAPPRPPAG